MSEEACGLLEKRLSPLMRCSVCVVMLPTIGLSKYLHDNIRDTRERAKAKSKSKETDNKININNKSKEKDLKVINLINNSNEKDGKVIVLSKSKGKDNKVININSKSKEKESVSENKKEPILIKNLNGSNKISISKNIKEVKKGNKSPNPGNGVNKKKIILGNPKQRQGPVIKISPSKISKEKINSAKKRVNTDTNNADIKKPASKQSQKPLKTVINRKSEKSPNPNLNTNKKQ